LLRAYFLLSFTLPAELRALARAHQTLVYGVLSSRLIPECP
jgi:hypothetical protein